MPHKPCLIHVITRLIVGGAQTSALELCAALTETFTVRIVAGPQTGAEGSLQRRAAEIAPLTIIEALRRDVSPRWDAVAVLALRRTISGLRPDLVHSHSSKAGIVCRYAARGLAVGVVHSVHGWGHTPADAPWRKRLFVGLERSAAHHCDALVAVSADVRDEGIALGIGDASLYRVIPEFVDFAPRHPDAAGSRATARRELGLANEHEVIGWVGRFVEQKDPSTLAKAVSLLLRARPQAQAVLIGDGPLRATVEAQLRKAGVLERVQMTGLRHNARNLMSAFDVLLHPTRWEGSPLVIQEAIAERVPVVAARVNGVADLLRTERVGLIVTPGAASEMAAAAQRLLDAPELGAPIPQEDIAELARDYGRATVLRRHLDLYGELLRAKRT